MISQESAPKRITCPCRENCSRARPDAVNAVLRRKLVLSNDLRLEIRKKVGEGAARRALRFLHHTKTNEKGTVENVVGCKHVGVLLKTEGRQIDKENNVIHFRGRNKVFYSRCAKDAQIQTKIRSLLAPIQEWLLESLEEDNFGTCYLSSYELRKLAPYPADHVNFALEKLLDLGFLEEVKVDASKIHYRTTKIMDISEIMRRVEDGSLKKALESPAEEYPVCFYTIPKHKLELYDSRLAALKEEMIEHETIKHVLMRILKKLPSSIELCEMRTRDSRLLKAARGFSFDVYRLSRDAFGTKRFLGVDVYTRLPVSEKMVNIFARKIRSARGFGRIYARGYQSSKVLQLCRKYRIGFINLKSTTIDYKKIRQDVETKVESAFLQGLSDA